jgi:hypothetical protein
VLKWPPIDHRVWCKEINKNKNEMDKRFVLLVVWELVPRMQADAWLSVRFRIRTSPDSAVHDPTTQCLLSAVSGAWHIFKELPFSFRRI